MCLTQVTWYSVSLSVSCASFTLLFSTGPYDENSGTSESCCAYEDCVSAKDCGGGEDDAFLGAGTPIVSKVLGPANIIGTKTTNKHWKAPHELPLEPLVLG